MRVAVDIDNTVQEWQYHWADLYQQWFDREIVLDDLAEWDACLNATHFENHGQFFDWYNRAHGWMTQPYVPGAAGALWTLQQAGIPFYFLTARPSAGEDAARQLAKDWDTHVQFRGSKNKHLSKATVWVDDSPDVLENLASHGLTAIRIVRPWNEGAPATHSAATWPEIVEILKEMQ